MSEGDRAAGSITFMSYGLRIRVEVGNSACLGDVIELLPPGWIRVGEGSLDRCYRLTDTGADGPARFGVVVGDGEWPERTFARLENALDHLEGEIQLYVAEFAHPELFVHAGVVVWHGRAIVLPGSSFAGKSTLVTSLARAGVTYYSDEYAVFDAEGRVRPYPRRVSLRGGPHGPAGRLDLAGRTPDAMAGPVPVGLVALLRYNAEAGWEVAELTGAGAIMAMCAHTVAIQRRPAETLAILGRVVEGAHVVQGTRGEVDAATTWLLDHAASAIPPSL